MIRKILAGILVLFFITAATTAVFEFSGNKMAQGKTMTILRGQNAIQIANELKAEGYIDSKLVFLYEVFSSGNWGKLKAGEYDLKNEDVRTIVDKLAKAKTAIKTLTIVPGWTLNDIINSAREKKLLEDNDFAAAIGSDGILNLKNEFAFLDNLPSNADMEGYLFPDTYQIVRETTAQDLTRMILKNFEQKISAPQGKSSKESANIRRIITMASMLEKEVLSLEDKKIVAGILYKRLKANMPLQVDSTLLYYKLGNGGAVNKEIDSPYNTYKYSGMPPGPICNPGIESIEAAIEPVETSYWYYLSSSDGTTIFSETYDQHLQNISQYLK